MRSRRKLDLTPPNSRLKTVCTLFALGLCLLTAIWPGAARSLMCAELPGVLFALALLCAESENNR